MRILFIQRIKGLSGSEKYLLEVIPALRARGFDCAFLGIYPPDSADKLKPFVEPLAAAGVTYTLIPAKEQISINLLNKINQIVKKGGYDCLHTHLIHADVYGACINLFSPALILVSTKHGYDEHYTSIHGFIKGKKVIDLYYSLAWLAEKFVQRSQVISQGLYSLYVGLGICKPAKIELIYYGFDLPSVEETSSGETSYRLSSKQLIIAGRLVGFKGHTYALQIMPKLVTRYPELKLLFVGNGVLEASLKAEAIKLGVASAVEFLGFQREVMAYMAASDVVLVPSISEGFGIVTIEAMNAGRPVVGFDVPATNEIIIHNETGLLAPPYDTEILFEHICYLLDNPQEAKRMADAAYIRLKTFFSLERMVDETVAFYAKVGITPN